MAVFPLLFQYRHYITKRHGFASLFLIEDQNI